MVGATFVPPSGSVANTAFVSMQPDGKWMGGWAQWGRVIGQGHAGPARPVTWQG